ncbi:capping protein, Arp2/3 and myosin-I linker protein 3-like isoform X2 [Cyprinus carpio]|uniref:Capping protein, Arp2/3 and myosin-I linker protein 3-like isoform X2 n=1 Tax=Cyprinus carpio TaxID=7962 RepID=A0A9R0BD30_CYPCA|nr:capping protein, Arp2/3 and myosin-I linker protein 3-like isoform X2 [Cyprinus carpio]
MAAQTEVPFCLKECITQYLKPQRVQFMSLVHLSQCKGRAESRVLVMSQWRAHVFLSKQPVKVESSFSYLEIYAITIDSTEQVVIETHKQIYSLSLMSVRDLEAVVTHVTASLKKIFPDSSPGKLLKKVPPDLQERLCSLASRVEEHVNGAVGPCGGFSDTYAALCDFNEFPCCMEVQWDVDNIYHAQNCRVFNLIDFSHLDSRDLALAVGALSFNQWFTKICSKDFKLTPDVQEQILYMIARSCALEEVSLEASGLKMDFAVKMASAFRDSSGSAVHIINLSVNAIEDKGVIALSQSLGKLPRGLSQLYLSKVSMSPKGLGCLVQALHQSTSLCNTLTHLDLSGNISCLATEDAISLFKFLSAPNAVSHLDLSYTDCPLDTLFVSLSVGCCTTLSYLNLSRNTFSHRKVREVTRSVLDFFSKSTMLKYVGLSGTKLPPEALRLLLQGLATNTHLSELELDISCCELRSAGAQVIQEHIFEAKAICSLDLSDNGFESNMVTLILSIGRSHSIRHLSIGRNFAMKSKALTDVLHRLVQLIQEEECPLESLSVCDSKLKTGTTILINSLGSNASLSKIDISGNSIGDTGAKMLAKALMINTKLKTLVWDRNNVTAGGFMDVANAMEKNLTLQNMSIPMSDVLQAYRNTPEKMEDALQKIQMFLHRNNQRLCGTGKDMCHLQHGLKTTRSEQLVQDLCKKLQESVHPLTCYNIQEVQSDILLAEEALQHAKTAISSFSGLYELGRAPSSGHMLKCILNDAATALRSEITEEIQELATAMLQSAQLTCPRVVQRSSVSEHLADCVAKKTRKAAHFIQKTIQETENSIRNKLSELKQSVSVSLVGSIIDEVLQDLSVAQEKLDKHMREFSQSTNIKANVPQLRVMEHEFPTDDYVPVIWRNSFHSRSIRPAPSIKSLLDVEGEQQARAATHPQQEVEERGGGGPQVSRVGMEERRRALSLSLATGLSVTTAGQLKPGSPSYSGREADAAAAPAAAAAALSNREPRHSEPAPPQPPMDLPIEGHTLRHYTRSRPRPNRRNRQPPSKPQEQAAESENEANENMGRVDEGVEEFFTKKIIPDEPLKHQREERLIKAQPAEPTCVTTAPPTTSTTTPIPTTAPSKNIKKKFGDFFAFKKVRAGRGAKGDGVPEGKAKKTSIADLIRPLREAARAEKEREKEREKEKEREREKEKEKQRDKEKLDEENIVKAAATTATTTILTITDSTTTAPVIEDRMPPRAPSPAPTPVLTPRASTPTPPASSPSKTEEVPALYPAAPPIPTKTPSPVPVVSPSEREKGRTLEKSRTPDGERRPKPIRRSLRDGKSQSLILLSDVLPEQDGTATQAKKHASESSSSFEQRLHVMLQRMGVTKTSPTDTKQSQSKDEELRKANSEGAILDKPEPPPTFMKPRTMSTSSDTRRPTRVTQSVTDFHRTERPLLPERPIGPLPPKPAMKPILLPGSEAARTAMPSPKLPSPSQEGQAEVSETISRFQPLEKEPPTPSPRKETPPAPSPRRILRTDIKERSERAQSVTEETLPIPRPRMKPSPQRRAVSVHEDSLLQHTAMLDPEELKAALPRRQRSPGRKRVNLGELTPCSEDLPEGKAGEKEDDTGQVDETDSTTVTDSQSEQSPSGLAEQVTNQERGETVSEEHTTQGETSDQRTESPSPETHMD